MGHKPQEIVTAGTALNRRNMVGAVHKMRKDGFILEFAEQVNTKESEQASRYGGWLADEIRAKTQDFSNLDDFKRFVLNKGYRFHTEKSLMAGYARAQKVAQGTILTEKEFIEESCPFCVHEDSYTPPETVTKVYKILVDLVKEEKLTPGDVFTYAAYRWCMNKPEAIIAYQISPYCDSPIHRKWAVNNCSTVIENEEARIKTCEFGVPLGTAYRNTTSRSAKTA